MRTHLHLIAAALLAAGGAAAEPLNWLGGGPAASGAGTSSVTQPAGRTASPWDNIERANQNAAGNGFGRVDQPNVLAAGRMQPQRAADKPVVHHGRKQWLRTLHIRAGDGSNSLVGVEVTATPGITVSYDPASRTVSGYGGPGTVTVTGYVETLNGNVPFVLTIPVQ